MITKRDAEVIERIVRSMDEDRYWRFMHWLGNGCDDSLWDNLRPRRRPEEKERVTALSPRRFC